jgi:hypothetical protein
MHRNLNQSPRTPRGSDAPPSQPAGEALSQSLASAGEELTRAAAAITEAAAKLVNGPELFVVRDT